MGTNRRNRNNDYKEHDVLKDFMLFFNSIGIAVIITILCCNRCQCCYNPCQQQNPCAQGYYQPEHRCPEVSNNPIIIRDTIHLDKERIVYKNIYRDGKIVRDTICIPQYIYLRDTTYIYKYIHNNDTIYIKQPCQPVIDNEPKPVTKEFKKGKYSIYTGAGVTSHDLIPDTYTTPYYKFSPTAFAGATYQYNDIFRFSGQVDYTAPYQFLYNSQYIGCGVMIEADALHKNQRHDLNFGIGTDYAHSYNIRTINTSTSSTSTKLTTNNLYIPAKLTYEYNFGNWSCGAYVRGRINVIGQDRSHKYFIDGGAQLRYNIK